ncbi:NPP1 family protein [Salinithrix halophila]
MKHISWVVICLILITGSILISPEADAAVDDTQLANRWAPVHYQDTDSSDYDADYLSAVNFDGDWDTKNNWEHQDDDQKRLQGNVYYSVSETKTHWFVLYGFYHPRDWVDWWWNPLELDTHENDMEGALMVIRKNETAYGKLEGMVTVFHNDFYAYKTSDSPLRDGKETIDGTIRFKKVGESDRPTTFQEAKGHGLKAWGGGDFPGGDGVIYYPGDKSEVPEHGKDRDVKYRLIDVFAKDGLWAHRKDSKTFASWGSFRGDNGKDNAAHAPWKWDDWNDGEVKAGEMATDPAHLVDEYFDGLGDFSKTYLHNPYK